MHIDVEGTVFCPTKELASEILHEEEFMLIWFDAAYINIHWKIFWEIRKKITSFKFGGVKKKINIVGSTYRDLIDSGKKKLSCAKKQTFDEFISRGQQVLTIKSAPNKRVFETFHTWMINGAGYLTRITIHKVPVSNIKKRKGQAKDACHDEQPAPLAPMMVWLHP
jgi:hypothetical protein